MASIVYVSSSTTDVITEIASTSEVIISNLQGPQGATGPQGPQGTPGGIASVVAPITNAGTETAAIIGINSSSANTANYVVQRDANKEFVAGAVTIDTTLTPTSAPGKLYWDGGGTVNLGLAGGNVSVALGENLVSYVTNAEATTLAVGEVVYVFGAAGDRPSVKRASNASEITSSKTLGIVAESIGANQIGFVITRGIIGGLALGSYTAGAPVYLGSTAGTFTSTKPVAPANLVALGWVIRANNGNGQIYVNVQNGFELEELHNVLITSAANGNFLVYDSATGLWKNQAISATAPVTYDAGTRTIAANTATTSATGVVQLSDSTSTTSSALAATPTAVKAAYDLASTANATANAAIPLTQKAAANGVATLDASGLVPTNQLPALAITNTFVVNSQAAMLALTAQTGDVAIRTDLNESFILTADPASTLANWQKLLTPPDAVTSVDGRIGAVTLTDKYAQLAVANSFTANQTITGTGTAGSLLVNTGAAANAGIVVRGFASQSGNLQVWQDSSSNNLVGIGGTGGIFINRTTGSSTTALIMSTGATSSVGIRVDGVSGQTGELQQWRDSAGGVLARVNASGVISSIEGIQSGSASFAGIAYNGISNPTGQTGLPSLIVKGIASQTAALQEWHSSAGLVSSMDTSGQLRTPTVLNRNSFNNARVQIRDNGTLIDTGVTTNIALTVQTTNASQTADYFQIQNSGATPVFRVAASNSLIVQYGSITTGTSTGLGQLTSVAGNASTIGAVIRGAASATADLFQAQNSAGTVLARIEAGGALDTATIRTNSITGSGGSAVRAQFSGGAANMTIPCVTGGAFIGLTIQGAASQTADLQTWTNNASSVLARIDSGGQLTTQRLIMPVGSYIVDSSAQAPQLRLNTGGFEFNTRLTTNVGIKVQGVASQSADLLQLQNSSGVVLDAFDNAGNQLSQTQLVQYGAEGSVLQNVPTKVHPAETLLKQAVWWIDAAHSSASGQTISNLGWGGAALNATNGSSTSADSNDAQYLAWDGVNYVYLPGASGNILSVPDAAVLDITGDIDIRVRVAPDDWTPSADTNLTFKSVAAGDQRSWQLLLRSTGGLQFVWYSLGTGASAVTVNSTANLGLTDGTPKWVRVTLDVDNGASGNDVKFWTSDDGTTWTQLGSTVTTAGTTSIYASTADVFFGSTTLAAKLFKLQICNGIDGIPVLDVDTSVISSGAATSFTALTGQTVTVNRATSGRKTTCVVNPVWLFGTDDYMEVNNRWLEHTGSNYLYLPGVAGNRATAPDSAPLSITGDIDIRAKIALDDWTPASATPIIAKADNLSRLTYQLAVDLSGKLNFLASNTGSAWVTNVLSSVATGISDGATKWIRATFDVDNGASGRDTKFWLSDDGTTWTQLGTTITEAGTTSIIDTTSVLEVGNNLGGAGVAARGKFFRAQVLNGIGGTVAFDANFETGITSNLPTTFTESSANAATVTINYSGTGYRSCGVIASTYVYPGNPNTFKLSTSSLLDFKAAESFTVIAAFRQWATQSSGRIISKRETAAIKGGVPGYELYNASATAVGSFIGDVNGAFSTGINSTQSLGSVATYAMAINKSTLTGTNFYNNVATSSYSISSVNADNSNLNGLTIGAWRQTGSFAQFADMEFASAAIFRRALTAAEIATISNYFTGRLGA